MRKRNFVLVATSLLVVILGVANGAQAPATSTSNETFVVKTKSFAVNFQVGDDGRLYQVPVGGRDSNPKLKRDDEMYPQAGDGYVWEPALEIVHADGNTSTALLYDGLSRTNESADVETIRVRLHDPAYPCEVTVCFRAHHDEDVIEQWVEIQHQEPGPVGGRAVNRHIRLQHD